MKSIGIVGAGFSGAVIARELARAGHRITIFEARSHVAGNCHTERDPSTGVMLHRYGPHIFHTSNDRVWHYVQQFDEFMPFVNRVKAIANDQVYSLPVNLLTINSFFKKMLSPKEAQAFIAGKAETSIDNPVSFEEQALKFVGKELYEAFFKGYTLKQWGISPTQLPASILKRLPLRFNYDDNYYNSKYQGMPKNGYSYIVEKILDHENIKVHLNTRADRATLSTFDHVFYSGPIDAWFAYESGRLKYRTLDFKEERHVGDYQGNPVINYCDASVPYTRISEHKHFSPWESHESTVIYKEYSRECGRNDIPYYPVRLVDDKAMLALYIDRAKQEKSVTFVGRLGTYRYLDMHVTIEEALNVADAFLKHTAAGTALPAFLIDPLA